MNKKLPIFAVTAYIPSDENIVVSDIKKVCEISKEGMCVIVSIKEQHGVGTGTEFPKGIYPDELDAVLHIIKCDKEDYIKIDRMTFEEALECEKKFIGELTKLLK